MTPEELRDALEGTVFGPVCFVGSTGSTNADLLAAARSVAPVGSVLVADHQTAGRGRRGRSWVAPAGSALLASVLLRPRWAHGGLALLSPATALAVRDACAAYGAEARLKWPNDVVAPAGGVGPVGEAERNDERGPPGAADEADRVSGSEPVSVAQGTGGAGEAKLAGVLAEFDSGEGTPEVVVGFGVNVFSHKALAAAVAAAHRKDSVAADGGGTADSPAAVDGPGGARTWRADGDTTDTGVAGWHTGALPPVALEELASRPVDRNELLVAVLLRLDTWYRRLHEPQGARDLLDELRRHSATLGRRVRVQTPGGLVVGRAADFTAQGHLVVATAEGPATVAAGDCHHLRPDET